MTDLTVNEADAAPVEVQNVPAPPMPRQTIPQMGQILPAIIAAMGEVQPIVKAEQNKEQGYSFASIDDFLAMINPICHKHGLIPFMEEDRVELVAKKGRYGDQDWLRFTYTITLWHVSGQHTMPTQRQVEVLRSGAQAYGSAQSYVLKQYLRGLFLIATGEKDDPDYGVASGGSSEKQERRNNDARRGGDDRPPQEERRAARPQQANLAEMVARLSEAQSGKELRDIIATIPANAHAVPEVAEARIERLRTLIKGAPSLVALEAFERNFSPDWGAVKADAEYRKSELEAEVAEKRRADAEEQLRQRRAEAAAAQTQQTGETSQPSDNADLGNDEIPY